MNSHCESVSIHYFRFREWEQEINLIVCEEYKTEREARDPNRTERKVRDEKVPAMRKILPFLFFRESWVQNKYSNRMR